MGAMETGLAWYARIGAVFGALILTAISVIMIYAGKNDLGKDQTYTSKATGKVLTGGTGFKNFGQLVCPPYAGNSAQNARSCSFSVMFTPVPNKSGLPVTAKFSSNSADYPNLRYGPKVPKQSADVETANGGDVTVYYDPADPSKNGLTSAEQERMHGIILIVGAAIILILSWLWVIFLFKSKQGAAVVGGVDILSDMTGQRGWF